MDKGSYTKKMINYRKMSEETPRHKEECMTILHGGTVTILTYSKNAFPSEEIAMRCGFGTDVWIDQNGYMNNISWVKYWIPVSELVID